MFTLYTPQTADKALPEVKRLFENIITQKNDVVALQEEIQAIIDSGNPFEGFIKKKQELNAAVTNLYRAIEHLEATGVIIKSVDEGLLDFPSRRFDEEVWLCWKVGENKVKFGHVIIPTTRDSIKLRLYYTCTFKRLAAHKTLLLSMPELDLVFPYFPAQPDLFIEPP